jgi:hypothetical protein
MQAPPRVPEAAAGRGGPRNVVATTGNRSDLRASLEGLDSLGNPLKFVSGVLVARVLQSDPA